MGQGFPKNLKRLREKNELTQGQLAELLEELGTPIPQTTLSEYERGNGEPRATKAIGLAKILGVTVEKLFEERKKPPPKVLTGRRPKKVKKEPTALELYFKKQNKQKRKKLV